jgi:hypothetical protein
VWFKLARAGNTFTGSVSSNGLWITVGSATVAMASSNYLGIAVCSRRTSALNTSTFDNISSAWDDSDIGAVGVAGTATETADASGAIFTVAGAGSDLGGTADSFSFANKSETGDCTIIARLTTEILGGGTSKVGLMMRGDLSPGAQAVSVVLNSGYGSSPPTARFMTRATTGGSATWIDGPGGITLPYWFKLVRTGNTFTGYISPNGTAWTTVGSSSVTMSAEITAGMAVTSRVTSALTTATFDQVGEW